MPKPIRHRAGLARILTTCALLTGAMAGAPQAQQRPSIDDVLWPWIGSYCSFTKAGHIFEFDDLNTWRFVFFTEFPETEADLWGRAFMRIDGQLRELVPTGVETRGATEVYRYRTHDAPPHEVTVEATPGAQGYESMPYSGIITVSRQGATAQQAFSGDCGV